MRSSISPSSSSEEEASESLFSFFLGSAVEDKVFIVVVVILSFQCLKALLVDRLLLYILLRDNDNSYNCRC